MRSRSRERGRRERIGGNFGDHRGVRANKSLREQARREAYGLTSSSSSSRSRSRGRREKRRTRRGESSPRLLAAFLLKYFQKFFCFNCQLYKVMISGTTGVTEAAVEDEGSDIVALLIPQG